MVQTPIIYFAGKIGKRDWRTELFGPRIGGCHPDEAFDVRHSIYMDEFIYGGPFFVACDHGCGHGAARHGVGIETNFDEGGRHPISEGAAACFEHYLPRDQLNDIRGKVHGLCGERIRRANRVFAFINEPDCFGTLAEVGMANAMGKSLTIGLGPNITPELEKELWFVIRSATAGVYRGTAQAVWARFRKEKLASRRMAPTAARL